MDRERGDGGQTTVRELGKKDGSGGEGGGEGEILRGRELLRVLIIHELQYVSEWARND